MKFKIAVGAMLVFIVALTGFVEAASYDLPKIKVEKNAQINPVLKKKKFLRATGKVFWSLRRN